MARMSVAATTRASFAMYNTKAGRRRARRGAAKDRRRKPRPRSPRRRRIARSSGARLPVAELKFPKPFAASPRPRPKLADTFEMLGDRDARNTYLLELADKLLPMPPALKNEQTRVHGCMSTVHLFGRPTRRREALDFLADSDAHIVRGLIAVLQRLFPARPPRRSWSSTSKSSSAASASTSSSARSAATGWPAW